MRNLIRMRKKKFLFSVCVSLKSEKFDEKQNKKVRDLLKQWKNKEIIVCIRSKTSNDENIFAIMCWFNDSCKCVCWIFANIWSKFDQNIAIWIDWKMLTISDNKYVDDFVAMNILTIYNLIEKVIFVNMIFDFDICIETILFRFRFENIIFRFSITKWFSIMNLVEIVSNMSLLCEIFKYYISLFL